MGKKKKNKVKVISIASRGFNDVTADESRALADRLAALCAAEEAGEVADIDLVKEHDAIPENGDVDYEDFMSELGVIYDSTDEEIVESTEQFTEASPYGELPDITILERTAKPIVHETVEEDEIIVTPAQKVFKQHKSEINMDTPSDDARTFEEWVDNNDDIIQPISWNSMAETLSVNTYFKNGPSIDLYGSAEDIFERYDTVPDEEATSEIMEGYEDKVMKLADMHEAMKLEILQSVQPTCVMSDKDFIERIIVRGKMLNSGMLVRMFNDKNNNRYFTITLYNEDEFEKAFNAFANKIASIERDYTFCSMLFNMLEDDGVGFVYADIKRYLDNPNYNHRQCNMFMNALDRYGKDLKYDITPDMDADKIKEVQISTFMKELCAGGKRFKSEAQITENFELLYDTMDALEYDPESVYTGPYDDDDDDDDFEIPGSDEFDDLELDGPRSNPYPDEEVEEDHEDLIENNEQDEEPDDYTAPQTNEEFGNAYTDSNFSNGLGSVLGNLDLPSSEGDAEEEIEEVDDVFGEDTGTDKLIFTTRMKGH